MYSGHCFAIKYRSESFIVLPPVIIVAMFDAKLPDILLTKALEAARDA